MDIIIVLGNSNENIMRQRVKLAVNEFNKPIDKLNQFQKDYGIDRHDKENKSIIFSGRGKGVVSEAEKMRDYALEMGMDKGSTFIESESMSTIENLQFVKKQIDQSHKKIKFIGCVVPTITICTSSFHIKRSIVLANMIFGCDYNLKFIHTDEPVSVEVQSNEWQILINSMEYLCGIQLGK